MNKLTSVQCGSVTMLFMVVMLMDSGVGALLQGVEQRLSTGVIEDTQNAINLGETKNEQLPTATVVGETQIEQPHIAQSHPTAAEFLSEHGSGQLDIASARKMEKKTQHATAKAKPTGNGCSGGGCGKAVSDEHDTSVNPDSASIDTKIETALSVVTEMWTGVGIGEATAMKVGVEQDVQHQDEDEAKKLHDAKKQLHDDTHHKQDEEKKADGEAEEGGHPFRSEREAAAEWEAKKEMEDEEWEAKKIREMEAEWEEGKAEWERGWLWCGVGVVLFAGGCLLGCCSRCHCVPEDSDSDAASVLFGGGFVLGCIGFGILISSPLLGAVAVVAAVGIVFFVVGLVGVVLAFFATPPGPDGAEHDPRRAWVHDQQRRQQRRSAAWVRFLLGGSSALFFICGIILLFQPQQP